jgi:dethiobiotin synthetase
MPIDVPGLFITGTDTGVGKTYVTARIAEQLRAEGVRVGAYKPVCSGALKTTDGFVWEDLEVLHAATGGAFPRERICPQRFTAPLAPPVAAKAEGRIVDGALLRAGATWWSSQCDFLLLEGAGGLLCPLTEDETIADLAVEMRLPLVIVARATLGTINHTLLTIEAARARRLRVAGVILNHVVPGNDDPSIATNAQEIGRRGRVAVLGIMPHGQPQELHLIGFGRRIDWRAAATAGGHELEL